MAENAPAVLDCIAAGNPTPTLFWMKEGEPNIILPGTHIKQLTVTPEGSLRIGKQSKIYFQKIDQRIQFPYGCNQSSLKSYLNYSEC